MVITEHFESGARPPVSILDHVALDARRLDAHAEAARLAGITGGFLWLKLAEMLAILDVDIACEKADRDKFLF